MHDEDRTLMENLSLNQTVLELQCYTIMATESHSVWSVSECVCAYPVHTYIHTYIYIYIYICVCVCMCVCGCGCVALLEDLVSLW
jgi:hypothetical protein